MENGSLENVAGDGGAVVTARADEERAGAEPMEVSEEAEEAAPGEEGDDGKGESEGEGDDLDDEDEPEDDPVLNEYEADGFLVLDEEEGGADAEAQSKLSRRKEDRFIPLEDDDLELIGEQKKSVKRLKRKGAVESEPEPENEEEGRQMEEGEEEVEDDDEEGRGSQPEPGVGAPRRLKNKLQREEEVPRDDDDDDGFIVGAKRNRSSASQAALAVGANRVTDNQLAEWQSIFGDDKGEEPFVPDGDYVPEGEDALDLPVARARRPAAAPAAEVQVKSLDKMFEPALLADQFLRKRDLEIKSEDVPERIQLRFPNRLPPEEGELDVEANWCLAKYSKKKPLTEDEQTGILHKIFYLLHFLRSEQNEVPFVYQYRVDDLHPLTEEDCWDVFDWDEEWNRLTTKKRQLMKSFGDLHEMVRLGAEERYVKLITEADAEEDLADLVDYFHLNFSEKVAVQSETRRKNVDNIVVVAKKEGFFQLATSMAITAAQLGENLWNNQLIHSPADLPSMPDVAAQALAEHMNVPVDFLLKRCRELLAKQVADDPYVRESIRTAFLLHGSVSTFPTEAGLEEIGFWHPDRNVKRLDAVPLKEFQGSDLFVRIICAEKKGLITVSIDVNDSLEEILELYQSKSFDATAAAWNKQRRMILDEALHKHLYPMLKRECRERLEKESFQFVARLAASGLRDRVARASYVNPPVVFTEQQLVDLDHDSYRGPRGDHVLAIYVPDDRDEAIYAAVVDRWGSYVESVKLSYFGPEPNVKSEANAARVRDDLRAQDVEKVRGLVLSFRPRVIAVSIVPRAYRSRQVYSALTADRSNVLSPLLEKLRSTLPGVVPKVLYIDGRVSRSFSLGAEGAAEFASSPFALRAAVSLARVVLDPLMEYCRLWNNTRDLCNIVFHPLQSVVPVEYVQRSFERVLVQVTALVGVDINNAVKHTHLRGTLQFVPGLGPRKAKALLEGIRSSGGVVATRMIDLRKFLVGNSETTTVWTNAIAYLRITAHHFGKDAERRGPLDDTRIHPNDFRFAVKVAQDALDRAEDVQMTEDLDELEAKRVEVLREVMGGNDDGPNPHIDDIIRVDVPGMAEAWRENYGENKARVLAALKDEMLAPFAEKRAEFKELKDSDAFFICVEAEPSEFVEGRLFDCVVRDVNRSMVRVEILDEELSGVIMHDSLSDSAKPCSELVKRGDSVQARLLKVDFSRWNLVLSSKGSDLLNLEKYENVRELESSCPYLRWTLAENERISARVEKKRLELERQMRSEIAKRSLMRVVDHPSFKNFGLDETLQALKDAPIGEAIFRPSSKGLDFLTLSYKGLPDLIVHVAILEKDKPHAAALGRRLEVQGVGEFEDLDELLARYVNPMVDGMAEVAAHHRFTPGDMAQVELLLREDKATHPNENVYRLAVDQVNVGYFKIVYISTERLHEQPFSVRPGGFRLRKRDFKSLKDMIAWFKRHASDPPGKSKPAASQGKK